MPPPRLTRAPMPNALDLLKRFTTVVADTGDIEAVRELKPVDCTTNPTLVLKALGEPMFEFDAVEYNRDIWVLISPRFL